MLTDWLTAEKLYTRVHKRCRLCDLSTCCKFSIMAFTDKALGSLLIVASVVIFVYYTLWVFVVVSFDPIVCIKSTSSLIIHHPFLSSRLVSSPLQPFVEPNSAFRGFFPDQSYAISVPVTLLVLAIFLVFMFVCIVIIRDAQKRSSKDK